VGEADAATIPGAIGRVRERIDAAAARAGLDASSVTLVAVSKGRPAACVRAAFDAGVRDFGENRAGEAQEKARELERTHAGDALRWHFVGRLQRNKVRRLIEFVHLVHSVDRLALAEEIGARASRTVDVLVEVNTSAEAQKGGVAPDDAARLVEQIAAVGNVRVTGLMTMAPRVQRAEDARPCFRLLADLRDDLQKRFPDMGIRQLSMGMSQDYEIAVEEGATLVRVGAAIFGPRSAGDDQAGAFAPASLR
jgi:pyridoxal phosphate enzyme (YggS family)